MYIGHVYKAFTLLDNHSRVAAMIPDLPAAAICVLYNDYSLNSTTPTSYDHTQLDQFYKFCYFYIIF